jgi:hypothetical protein
MKDIEIIDSILGKEGLISRYSVEISSIEIKAKMNGILIDKELFDYLSTFNRKYYINSSYELVIKRQNDS